MKNISCFLWARPLFLAGAFLCALPSALVHAADVEAQAAKAPILSLSAEASRTSAHDKVSITLSSEVQAVQQADVAQKLNQAVRAVLASAADAKNVQAHNGAYSIWLENTAPVSPTQEAPAKQPTWRGYAHVIIESGDFEAASRFAASMQAHMTIQNLRFSLSEQARAKLRHRLLDEAAAAFRAKARQASVAFGFANYRISRIELVDGMMGGGFSVNRMQLSVAEAAPLQGGQEEVKVKVSGEILLYGKRDQADAPPNNAQAVE